MKFIIVFLSCSVLFGSCAKRDNLTKVFVGQEFSLKVGERLDLMDSSLFLAEIKIIEINDNRCPVNAQCIRAGEALVSVGLTGINEKLITQNLCIGDCPMTASRGAINDTVTVIMDNLLITLILGSVEPYPSLDDLDPVKSATMIFESYSFLQQ